MEALARHAAKSGFLIALNKNGDRNYITLAFRGG